MKHARQMDMIQGPIFSKLIVFSIPVILSGVLQLLFNAADVIVVGRFTGSRALAAVGSTSSLINLLINLFLGISIGANVLVGQYIGARDVENAQKAVHTGILFALFGGLFMGVFGFFAAGTLLSWMATPEDVLPLSTIYMQIYLMLFQILNDIAECISPDEFLTDTGTIRGHADNIEFRIFVNILTRISFLCLLH